MGYMVITSTDFSNKEIREFDGFDEACEFAGKRHNLGQSVEVIQVAAKFVPKAEKVIFEEVV